MQIFICCKTLISRTASVAPAPNLYPPATFSHTPYQVLEICTGGACSLSIQVSISSAQGEDMTNFVIDFTTSFLRFDSFHMHQGFTHQPGIDKLFTIRLRISPFDQDLIICFLPTLPNRMSSWRLTSNDHTTSDFSCTFQQFVELLNVDPLTKITRSIG